MTDTSTSDLTSRDRLTRVETKLDTLLLRLDPQHNDHELRIRALEQKVWVASGFAAAGGSGLTAILLQVFGGG